MLLIISGCSSEPVTDATSSDGVTISFDNRGKGEPAIVLVHGWTNDRTIWDQQIPGLLEKYQVVAVDLPGHGKSGNNRSVWTTPAFGEDVAAVVQAAGLDEVILVGFSLGGPVILEAAKVLKEKVIGLILVETLQNPEDKLPPQMLPIIDSMFMDLINNVTPERLIGTGFFREVPEDAIDKIQKMLDRDPSAWQEILAANYRWVNEDCLESLEEIEVPIIAINADYIPTATEVYRKYVPSFEAKILSGSGHVIMWEIADEFNRTLEESILELLTEE